IEVPRASAIAKVEPCRRARRAIDRSNKSPCKVPQNAALAACGFLVAGCAQINVSEAVLSTNQKVAMVSTPGDSVSPPANLVLLANPHGQYVPVATGFGPAPVPALLNGAGAGAAIGEGI